MTAPALPQPPAAAPAATVRPARARRPRRWHRAAVPFLVFGLLCLITGIAHAVQEPDLDEAGTLSPTGTGPDGSSRLAELLAAKGVTVRRVTSSAEAVRALATDEPLTVFVPAPDMIDPNALRVIVRDRGEHRLVLVRPGRLAAATTGFAPGLSRWAAKSVPPECDAPEAVTAGRAAVLRSRYLADPEYQTFTCYRGGLVGLRAAGTEVVAVGATDPFRNSRIDEAGNAALAVGLLGRDRAVVWIDVHRTEPRPVPPPPEFSLPDYHQPERGSSDTSPMWGAFPPALWASLALLAALALLTALVRARRLGPPVAEPLPVVVPATEIVAGRGRLYQRIRARSETFDALRDAALRRLAAPPGDRDALVARLAERTGRTRPEVHDILYPLPPETDDELTEAVARLDDLVATALRAGSRPTPAAGTAEPGGTVNVGGTP